MTLKELSREVMLIGCDELPYALERTSAAANRALAVIFSEHSVMRDGVIKRVPEGGGGYAEIELSELFPDLASVVDCRVVGSSRRLQNARILGTILTLPRSFSGELRLTYKRRPSEVSSDEPDAEVDLPPHLLPLLLPLTASFVWCEESEAIAERCAAEYRALSDFIRRGARQVIDHEFAHNGWA